MLILQLSTETCTHQNGMGHANSWRAQQQFTSPSVIIGSGLGVLTVNTPKPARANDHPNIHKENKIRGTLDGHGEVVVMARFFGGINRNQKGVGGNNDDLD